MMDHRQAQGGQELPLSGISLTDVSTQNAQQTSTKVTLEQLISVCLLEGFRKLQRRSQAIDLKVDRCGP